MIKLRYSISAIATIVFATVAEPTGMFATATLSPIASRSLIASRNSSNPTRSFPSAGVPGWLAQSNYWSDCRKVVQNYTQFYTNFPGTGGLGTAILNNGDRIRLLDGGRTYQGSDGRFYYRISSPYGSQNPTLGYISVDAPLNRCGHSARW